MTTGANSLLGSINFTCNFPVLATIETFPIFAPLENVLNFSISQFFLAFPLSFLIISFKVPNYETKYMEITHNSIKFRENSSPRSSCLAGKVFPTSCPAVVKAPHLRVWVYATVSFVVWRCVRFVGMRNLSLTWKIKWNNWFLFWLPVMLSFVLFTLHILRFRSVYCILRFTEHL